METSGRKTHDSRVADPVVVASGSAGGGLRHMSLVSWVCNRLNPARSRRLLFLDDDPERAEIFLKENPRAIWVTTVAQCLARLDEPWEEVHLDHDLAGQTFVDSRAGDCGMEVVRWLCKEPRPHLKGSLFVVHTHHEIAGMLMVLQMQVNGYRAKLRPFGIDLARLLSRNEPPAPPGLASRVKSALSGPLKGLGRSLASAIMTQLTHLLSRLPRGDQAGARRGGSAVAVPRRAGKATPADTDWGPPVAGL
jgi:hypothetical protein